MREEKMPVRGLCLLPKPRVTPEQHFFLKTKDTNTCLVAESSLRKFLSCGANVTG